MLTALVVSLSLTSSPPMKEAVAALAKVQPLVASPDAFRDSANRAAVADALETLARLEHPFVRPASTSGDAVAKLFGRQLAAAKVDFERGRTEAARYRAQTVSQLCIGCHVHEPAKDFADAQKVAAGLKLPPLQQAQLYATTRQLDRAVELWKAELVKPVTLDTHLFEQLDALRLALRVLVPLRDDARLVRSLLVPQLTRKALPDFVRNELSAWEKDAKAWEAERFVVAGKSGPELLAKAKALVAAAQAERVVTAQPMHFIKLLRAASYLDEALRREPDGASRGEELYLLGVTHATVVDAPLWELEWMFLEACIRESPHSAQARTCGARLKSRTFVIWNADRDVPPATWTAMSELMALTLPVEKAP